MAMDLVSSVVNVLNLLWVPVARRIGYLRNFKENLRSMKEAVSQLQQKRDDVKRMVDVAEGKLLTCTNQVKGWLQSVEAIEAEANDIEQSSNQRTCLGDCCPNCRSIYKLSKKAEKKRVEVIALLSRGASIDVVAESRLPDLVNAMPRTSAVGMDLPLERVRSHLKEVDVGIVGIYGMGGVGKTTLLRMINNEFLVGTHDFDVVIWVVVSKEVHMSNIQEAIGDRLGLSHHKNKDQMAKDIFKVLNKKKFVLLFDDIWERLDLDTVGIPRPDNQNKCKVIFTTRSEDVCGGMGAHKKIKVECLAWKEAWDLFREKAGEEAINSHPETSKLAEAVAEKCGGLPLALIVIGRAMASKKTPEEWSHAITVLHRAPEEVSGVEGEVLSLLKFSYDNLRNDTMRSCFLYCSLFPEDYSIKKERLIQYWIGEGFICDFDDIDEAYNKGHDLIGSLKVACLLETGDKESEIKMHDMIRDLALWIDTDFGRRKNKLMVHAGVELTKAPGVERWEDAERISLTHNQIEAIIEMPKCPNLLTLMLRANRTLNKISDNFFRYMPSLRVLDISRSSIEELPMGISYVVKLRHLGVSKTNIKTFPMGICKLAELQHLSLSKTFITTLPMEICKLVRMRHLDLSETRIATLPMGICKLVELQYLDLSGTKIAALPKELGGLVKLKNLDLRHTESLISIPRDMISRLSRLQVLNLYVSYGDWEERESGVYLEEMERLKCLKTLGITIGKVPALKRLLGSPKLLQWMRRLHIRECKGLTSINLLSAFGSMKSLRKLCISRSFELEELIIGAEDGENRLLSSLEKLTLDHLPNLKIIPEGAISHQCLQKLCNLVISDCHELKNISWVLQLQSLKRLTLSWCNGIEEVIGGGIEAGEEESMAFPKLEKMSIQGLPELKSICRHALIFPSLVSFEVRRCPKLKKLPLGHRSAKRTLREIHGEKEWCEGLEWDDESIKSAFFPYFTIAEMRRSEETFGLKFREPIEE